MVFAMINCTEKISFDLFFRNGNVFALVLGIVSFNPCTMHFPDHFWPDLIIPYYQIILIKFLLWENLSSKNEVINDRVY